MADSVKVMIAERNGVDLDFNEELDLLPENIPFTAPGVTATDTKGAILETNGIAIAQRYPITLQHNGTVSNGTVLGYSSLLPGDSTPVVVVVDGTLKEFTWSNSNTGADYTLEFRKNTLVGTPLYTISKTNTQTFVDLAIDIDFLSGDIVNVKYVDNGGNSSDATLVMYILNDGV